MLETEFETIKVSIKFYEECKHIFDPKCLSLKLLSEYITTFCNDVNTLFTKFTNYSLEFEPIEDSKNLSFYVSREGKSSDISCLSSFEMITLQVCSNNALKGCVSGSFFIIDESHDCIDQSRFITCLPDIISNIKQQYQTILLISHRDILDDLIDAVIKIKSYANYSIII